MMISVVQPGARLHYAVPEIFAHAGILKSLYTDLHAEHYPLRLLDELLPTRARPKFLRRLLGRRLPTGLAAQLVKDRPIETIARTLVANMGYKQVGPENLSSRLLKDLECASLGPGDIVYTVLINEDIDTMRRLKARGIKIVHECIIGPDVGLLLAQEHLRFPNLEKKDKAADVETGRTRDREKYDLCDMILVPSTFTYKAVAELAPPHAHIETVPYGLDLNTFGALATPEPGRILTVGTVGLRKGHPDLAAAARQLAHSSPNLTIRVVGPAPDGILEHPEMKGPIYVGQVPRLQVRDEFARADVFAFPTICDSFGLVLIEAMAMGVPIVATSNCGDVVRHGVDGFVVPPRDPTALAAAIKSITEDRALRERMSSNARERSKDFSLKAYADRLLSAMKRV